jgi:hypothetical protein
LGRLLDDLADPREVVFLCAGTLGGPDILREPFYLPTAQTGVAGDIPDVPALAKHFAGIIEEFSFELIEHRR